MNLTKQSAILGARSRPTSISPGRFSYGEMWSLWFARTAPAKFSIKSQEKYSFGQHDQKPIKIKRLKYYTQKYKIELYAWGGGAFV